MTAFTSAANRLWQAWREPPVEEPLDGRIRAAQITAILRLTPLMMLANLFNEAVLLFTMWDSGPRVFLAVWGSMVCAASLIGMYAWARSHHRPAKPTRSRHTVQRAVRHGALLGLCWAVVQIVLFPSATGPQQLVIASLILAMMCGGAFTLAVIPAAAIAYTILLAVGGVIALTLSTNPVWLTVCVLISFYAIMVSLSVGRNARLFTDRLLRQAEIEQQGQVIGLLLRDFEENASDWLWELDTDGRLQWVSPRLSAALCQPASMLRGVKFADFLEDPKTDGIDALGVGDVDRLLRARAPFSDVTVAARIGDELRWWSLTAKPVHDINGGFTGYRGVGRDVTDAKHAEARIMHMARYDALTDLPNRVLLRENLTNALKRVKRGGGSLAVLCLDLDHFKVVNDTLGHSVGDALLTRVGERLLACVGEHDTVARLGGDEFAILQRAITSPDEAEALAWRIIEMIAAPYDVDGIQIIAGGSIGIAIAPQDGNDPDQILKHADLALYRAKDGGRSTCRFFEPEMEARAKARRCLELDLREALANDQIDVHYQPLVDLASGTFSGFEALARWTHPVRGAVPPAEFIPVAEETGLISRLGEFVLRQACHEAQNWPAPLRISVNLSAIQFRTSNIVLGVIGALADSGLAANRLELEITESVLMDDTEMTLATLHNLRALGVRIALDDFGTGYSSLGYLNRFPFDKIKIDRSFVQDMAVRRDCLAIVRAIVSLAGSLDMITTAEGVETEDQLAQLRAEGCIEGQGYLFSRPVPAAAVSALLKTDQTMPRAAIA
ncbi:MAG: diguanylate cyclase [Xanthobacteraceae bacterium]|nr:diguanylate cyclase [Xanthobacteraceae bacterium]